MAQAGLDPVAGYTGVRDGPARTSLARAYPLALVTPANHYFLNSIFARPAQRTRSGPPAVLIHPDDAEARHSEW
jgi:anaerobic selenocysteine-containing dehydrogenase